MAIVKKQYYGIKYPFTCNSLNNFFIDLNSTIEDKVASEIAHVVLTPKGLRLRNPDFGTGVIKYIFDPNDDNEWDLVKSEVRTQVAKYVPNANIEDITIEQPEDNGIYLNIVYGIKKGETITHNRQVIKL